MYQQIGLMVQHHRKRLGLSRLALAKLSGVGKTAIYDIEKGKATAQLETLVKILKTLNIELLFKTPTLTVKFEDA